MLNKPAGISVVGERHETDLMKLAREDGEWLMPAHRIDKVTSGAIVLAKNLDTHAELARQFHQRTVDKTYLAITRSTGLPEQGLIDLPLSVGRKSRVRVAADREAITEHDGTWSIDESDTFSHVKTYPARTAFAKILQSSSHSLLAVRPITGRRHQIRVHLAWVGHPIDGDPLFAKTSNQRTSLHSWRIAFSAYWSDNARIEADVAPGADFWDPKPRLPLGDDSVPTDSVLDQARYLVRRLESTAPLWLSRGD